MSLRRQLVLAIVLVTSLATVAVGTLSYVTTVNGLVAEIDRSLGDIAAIGAGPGDRDGVTGDGPARGVDAPDGPEDGPPGEVFTTQILDGSGGVVRSEAGPEIPVDEIDRDVAGGTDRSARVFREVVIGGERHRLLTAALPVSGAVQVLRSLSDVDRMTGSLRGGVALAIAVVVMIAAAVGWLVARRLTARLARLAGIADEVAATGRLDVPVPVRGTDEAGSLGTAFEAMLASLQRSREAQRRLVEDAGHELRTPLTSIRTNIAVLRRHPELAADAREQLVDDLDAESRELTDLATDLVALARDEIDDDTVEAVVLGPLVRRAAERCRRRTGRASVVDADDSVVMGQPAALDRAVTNLLDNAAKFDTSGEPFAVEVRSGTVTVADRGPGIPADDLAHVFDRFYRSTAARGSPGSGLGLAIVRDVAEAHGGTVFACDRPGGGARVGFSLPVVSD